MSTPRCPSAVLLIALALIIATMSIEISEAARPINLISQFDPNILLTPNVANPGSFVKVSGTGFANGYSKCSITSPSPTLFQGSPQCFGGENGNITGIFQVNTLASKGVYVVSISDFTLVYNVYNRTYTEQDVNASIIVIPPLPPAAVLVTTTRAVTNIEISTFISTTTQKVTEISTGVSVLEVAIAASVGAVATAVAAWISLLSKNAAIRALKQSLDRSEELLKPSQVRKRPDFDAFTIDVRSGIEHTDGQA